MGTHQLPLVQIVPRQANNSTNTSTFQYAYLNSASQRPRLPCTPRSGKCTKQQQHRVVHRVVLRELVNHSAQLQSSSEIVSTTELSSTTGASSSSEVSSTQTSSEVSSFTTPSSSLSTSFVPSSSTSESSLSSLSSFSSLS